MNISRREHDDADNSARVGGQEYVPFLANLHKQLRPTTYFEIGTLTGDTLKLADCASIAVDPKFRISSDVLGQKPSCMFFQETSDTFFRCRHPKALFGREIDLAFLDGMHLFEFLLRDFMNTERYCRPNSLIILHDCLPPGFYMTTRSLGDPMREKSRFNNWWTGDVWRIIPVLQKYRPDLAITITDCAPTGLVLITNLNPENAELDQRYSEIISSYSRPDIDRIEYDEYWGTVKVTPSSQLSTLESLTTKYWL